MQTTTFEFTCRNIVGKLSILVVLLLMGKLYLPIIFFIKTFSQNSWLLFEVLAYQKTVFEFVQIFTAEKYYKIFKTWSKWACFINFSPSTETYVMGDIPLVCKTVSLIGIKENNIIWTNPSILLATSFVYYSVHIIKSCYFL